MDYSGIVERSFRLAWRYKSLWILGLFAGSGTTGFSYGDQRLNFAKGGAPMDPSVIFSEIAPFLGVLLWLGLILLVAYCLAKPALIDGVNRLTRGGVYTLADSFSTGVSMFFRFLGITILGGILMVAAILLMVMIFVALFAIHPIIGIVMLLPGIPAFFALIWVYLSVFQLAERAIVVRNTNIADAISEGWQLFRNHLAESGIIVLIIIGLSIGLAIVSGIIMFIVGAPIAAAILALDLPLLPALVAGFLMALPVSIIIGGFVGAAMTTLYTLFYFELVEPGGVHSDLLPESTPPV